MKQVAKTNPQGHAALAAIDLDRADIEIEATRNQALLTFAVENVQHMDGVELAEAQSVLRHGATMGTWVTPRDWLTPGTRDSFLSIDLRQRIVNCLPEQLRSEVADEAASAAAACGSLMNSIRLAVLTLSRYLVLLRMGPSGMGRIGSHRSLGPSTILNIAYSYGPALLAQAVVKQVGRMASDTGTSDRLDGGHLQEVRLLSGMALADLSKLTAGMRKLVLPECNRMRMLADRALWLDLPSTEVPSLAALMTGPVQHNEQPAERDSHLPLPDDYVAQMGSRSLWLMRDLAPNLLAISQRMTELWAKTGAMGWADATVGKERGKGVRKLLAKLS